ncbi:response regulator transcription factor [Serratia fonticola]|uniref:Response regulator transcription factor n=1 Tax=Serratia fonticola TaxID=47917 RepID=A0AAJ1YGI9_SERFO|nr:response regulator transcription factor [Serratia fonticola]MDQ9129900.1 response regulator transcription factor [Serratia fonticola]
MHSVLVIDESTIISVAIKSLLMQSDLFKSVFIAASSQQSLDIVMKHHIDLIITDVELQGDDCFLFLKKIKIEFPKIKFLFFSSKNESIYSIRALEARANGFISKGKKVEELLFAIKHILKGYLFFSAEVLSEMSDVAVLSKSPKHTRTLTTREINILRYLVKGLKNKEIANHLFISEKTVSTYKTRIMAKLGVNSVMEMINYVRKNGLM